MKPGFSTARIWEKILIEKGGLNRPPLSQPDYNYYLDMMNLLDRTESLPEITI